jgi:ATP-dependent Clp protease protease subunit
MPYIPSVIEKTQNTSLSMDLFSRLLKDRIIMLYGEVNSALAQVVTASLLYLEAADNSSPISMYINSPGGVITDGLEIIDVMHMIKSPVHTIGLGISASMAAVILAAGEKGHRSIIKHGEVMIHQPLGGARGQSKDIEIAAEHILRMKKTLYNMLSDYTGRSYEEIEKASDRDNFMTAEQAKEFGLIDTIL